MSTNPETEFSLITAQSALVLFEFRDFKYLSNVQPFSVNIDDANVLNGLAPGSIEIDFNKLEDADATGESKFVVGGRAYFEANLFGTNLSSFVTKGFFDKEGYVEPPPNSLVGNHKVAAWSSIGGILILAGVILLVYCCCKRDKDSNK